MASREEESVKKKELGQIVAEARELGPKIVSWRRHLHMYPEPSMGEHETAAFVVERLREIGVDAVREGVGQTGVPHLARTRKKV